MTNTSRNKNVRTPTSSDVRAAVAFSFLALAWCWPTMGRAGDDLPGPLLAPPSQMSVKKDLATTILLKRALDRNEVLAAKKLNLYVSVKSGIARLSGPVPSEEVRKRVVEVVAQVPGVLKVQSAELYLAKPHEKPKPLVLPTESEKPTRTESASPNPASASLGTLAGREPVPSAPPRIALMAPEAVSGSPPAPQPAVLTAQPRATPSTSSLSTAIENLRRRDARFRSIRVEVQGGLVRIFAGNANGEHVMAFAQALTRLPGVERVSVQDTSSR